MFSFVCCLFCDLLNSCLQNHDIMVNEIHEQFAQLVGTIERKRDQTIHQLTTSKLTTGLNFILLSLLLLCLFVCLSVSWFVCCFDY
jgi:hypothetical protein